MGIIGRMIWKYLIDHMKLFFFNEYDRRYYAFRIYCCINMSNRKFILFHDLPNMNVIIVNKDNRNEEDLYAISSRNF